MLVISTSRLDSHTSAVDGADDEVMEFDDIRFVDVCVVFSAILRCLYVSEFESFLFKCKACFIDTSKPFLFSLK